MDFAPASDGSQMIDVPRFLRNSGKTLSQFRGPILLTAPHGISLLRPGHSPHGRERHTTALAVILSRYFGEKLGGGSFVVWNEHIARPQAPDNLDPNYLRRSQFQLSPFSVGLASFKRLFYGTDTFSSTSAALVALAPTPPHCTGCIDADNICDCSDELECASLVSLRGCFPRTLHLDFHGKVGSDSEQVLDIGIAPMIHLWLEDDEVIALRHSLKTNFVRAFTEMNVSRQSCGKVPFLVNDEPVMDGYWGDARYSVVSLSHQSVLLAMPAVMLEFPPELRIELCRNSALLEKFGDAIIESFYGVFGYDALADSVEKRRSVLEEVFGQSSEFEYDEFFKFAERMDNAESDDRLSRRRKDQT